MKHPYTRTIEALEKIITQMQYLVDHPRMQQRNWVARGKEWLPVLHHAKEDLSQETSQHDLVVEQYQSLLSTIERVGLVIEKRDETTWGYRWHNGALIGTFRTQSEALEAGLKERLKA